MPRGLNVRVLCEPGWCSAMVLPVHGLELFLTSISARHALRFLRWCRHEATADQVEHAMICTRHIPILTLVPDGHGENDVVALYENQKRCEVPVGSVPEALRLVRLHRPGVLVLDLTAPPSGRSAHANILGVIQAVRRRVPRLPVVVLGPVADPDIEQDARCMGATVYLNIETPKCYERADRLIESLRPRDGSDKPHAPPPATGGDMPP